MHIRMNMAYLLGILLLAVGCQQQVSHKSQIEIDQLSEKQVSRLNVILITINSLRADHVSSYGYDRETTPHFDDFAKDGILFENTFATSSWQMPAVGSILTSLYPSQHGATHIEKKMKDCITLPGILKEHGYYAVGFCCNPRLTELEGFAQGFDFYDDYSVNLMLESLNFGKEDATLNINQQRTNDLTNDAAIRWIDKNSHSPFFLSVHYYDNHWDYLPPKPYDTLYSSDYSGRIDGRLISKEPLYSNKPGEEDVEQIIALYDGQVRQTDEDLGELLASLKKMGKYEDSIIIVMADHGEQFYEHGNTSHHGLYDELIHVPLAISMPDSNARSIQSLVSNIDIMPTVLDCLGIAVPEQCMGKSLMPLIHRKTESIHDCLFVEYTGGAIPDVFGVRSQEYKYLHPKESEAFGFDLKNDPGEQKPLKPESFTEEILRLKSYCQKMLDELGIYEKNQQGKEMVQQ